MEKERDGREGHEHVLRHGRQLIFSFPIALPAVAGVTAADQAHAADVGTVEDGTQAALITTRELVFRAIAAEAILLLAATVSDQRRQRTVADGSKRRFILE
jgi:hypothetical protein